MDLTRYRDPIKLQRLLWPEVSFYSKQKEVIYSVFENDETVVPAGNMLGKDYVAGFIALAFFLTRHPCRIVTTSADYAQLEAVLWGEIRRWIASSRFKLSYEEGGPLIINHLHIRKWYRSQVCGISYLLGRTASKGEGMLGHHANPGECCGEKITTHSSIPRTLFIADEASGVEDITFERADTWAARKLIIGNPYPCSNHFKKAVKEGDILAKE